MLNVKRFCAVVAFGIAASLIAARASASTIYSYYYAPGQTSYTVPAGSSLTVPLYLQEVNSDQSTNSLLVNEDGLSEAGVNVSYFSGSASATITGTAANTGTVPSGFDDPTSSGTVNSTTSATITESTDPPPFGTDAVGVKPGTQADGVSEVYLGTVTIQAGSQVGQQTTFTVAVADPASSSTFTNDNNYDLDNNGDPLNPAGASSLYFSAASTNFSITTTAVPEPSLACLIALAGLCFTTRRRPVRSHSERTTGPVGSGYISLR